MKGLEPRAGDDYIAGMLSRALSIIKDFMLDRPSRSDWREASTLFPVKLNDGAWSKISGGRLWRRPVEGRWEYRQDRKTADDIETW
jgi:hypothetical protein